MAYFSNGTEGEYYQEKFCDRCVHNGGVDDGCPVMGLHLMWNYDAVGTDKTATKAYALEMLWPRDGVHNGDCKMFHPLEGE